MKSIPYGSVKMRYLPSGGCVPANKKETAKIRRVAVIICELCGKLRSGCKHGRRSRKS